MNTSVQQLSCTLTPSRMGLFSFDHRYMKLLIVLGKEAGNDFSLQLTIQKSHRIKTNGKYLSCNTFQITEPVATGQRQAKTCKGVPKGV